MTQLWALLALYALSSRASVSKSKGQMATTTNTAFSSYESVVAVVYKAWRAGRNIAGQLWGKHFFTFKIQNMMLKGMLGWPEAVFQSKPAWQCKLHARKHHKLQGLFHEVGLWKHVTEYRVWMLLQMLCNAGNFTNLTNQAGDLLVTLHYIVENIRMYKTFNCAHKVEDCQFSISKVRWAKSALHQLSLHLHHPGPKGSLQIYSNAPSPFMLLTRKHLQLTSYHGPFKECIVK